MRSADEGLEVGQNEASRADREQRDLEEGLRNLLAERDRFMGLVKSALEAHEQAVAGLREAAERLREVREVRETRRARLASLREVIERRDDVGAGTRHLLSLDESARRSFGIRGLVRDLLEVDREVEAAVEAVLADRAEAIVVERPAGALSALEDLRSARAGRGIFVTSPEPEPGARGFVPLGQPLFERVRPRPGFEDLARSLLAGVNLVDSLREVIEVYGAGRIPATFVTPAGDLLTPDGVISGGSRAEGEGAGGPARACARGARSRTRGGGPRRPGRLQREGPRGRRGRARPGLGRAREPAQSPPHGGPGGGEPREGSRADPRAGEGPRRGPRDPRGRAFGDSRRARSDGGGDASG